jgi:hypothetical protein
MKIISKIFAWLKCDNCGTSTNTQSSWDTLIKILCENCSKK